MRRYLPGIFFLLIIAALDAGAQTDSIAIQVRPDYDKVSKMRRLLFGENYRKEFAATTTVPIIRISQVHGGLTPEKGGGGMQTISLRLKDKNGKEWVLRKLEKNPDPLIPEPLRKTFIRDALDDYMSAQHPFAPLIVPVLAKAANVPHANPVIGMIAPDSALGEYQKLFAGTIALLEEREPIGNSDNTVEMQQDLKSDNDNSYNAKTFLRARLLDLLLSDWDRHPDQYRWVDIKKGKGKLYEPVPRDRDQALFKRQGLFPWFASRPSILPTLQGFESEISRVKFSLLKSNFINGYMASQLGYEEWMQVTRDFTKAITDSVIEAAFKKLPASAYRIRGEQLVAQMKERRNNIPRAMEEFYRFINRKLDIEATDKNELFEITGTKEKGLKITARKLNAAGEAKDILFSKIYDPAITQEIRLYLHAGNDSVVINNRTAPVRLRVIGGNGQKAYNVVQSRSRLRFYKKDTAFVPVNLYHLTIPLFTAGYNLDDGVLFGLGFKHIHQGFRKLPYASVQQLMIAHSFSTNAYRITYRGEWLKVAGNADFQLQAVAKAPDNTQNFFGRGNVTPFNKTGDFKRFYRTRFAIFQVDPAFRWRTGKATAFSIGPSFQYYRYDAGENTGRLISFPSLIGSYDSLTVDRDKAHLGVVLAFSVDKRNSRLFPSSGASFNIRVQGYGGLNNYSQSFVQVIPEATFYQPLNASRTIVLAERLGGGISLGKTAFYQSLFIGGHENLLGYRQFRFAGQHSLYNNLELRMKIANFASYILPGQLGLTYFFDIGRVWETKNNSGEWHTGAGGGVYFAPAQLLVLQLVAGHSKEGWLPYFTLGFRF
jgi:hypothetical protein